jgi:hypothetical protein
MSGAIPLLPQYTFMAWSPVKKRQEQLYFYFYIYQIVLTSRNMVNGTTSKVNKNISVKKTMR